MAGQDEKNPLVTFVLFHYNQESLVAGAMKAALAQDYSPLEIIVSDDCSSDGTWAAIQRVADRYRGPHQLRVVRNESNMGIGPHVGKVGMMARGELIVQADGDDISAPSRVSRIVAEWVANGKPEGALHSAVRIPDKNGQYRVSKGRGADPAKASLDYFVRNQFRGQFYGAAAAYTKGVFSRFPPLCSGFEDVALNFRALLIGRVIYVDGALVDYNFSDSSVSHPLRIWERERGRRWFNSIHQNLEAMELDYAHYLASEGSPPDKTIVEQLAYIKHKINRARGILSFNPFRFVSAMRVYPYGVSFREWFGFCRFFFGIR